jgi:hypothetical protein
MAILSLHNNRGIIGAAWLIDHDRFVVRLIASTHFNNIATLAIGGRNG